MELVNIYSAMNEMDAELLRSLLESEGIPAIIRADANQGFAGLTGIMGSQLVGRVCLLVRPEHAEQAEQIVSEVRFEPDIPAEEICEGE